MSRQKGRQVVAGERSDALSGASMRVALYARVSTPDQDPGMQIEALTAEADRRGLVVHDVYIDHVSGAKDRRPGLDGLMRDVRAGKVGSVMVWKFDRFARSTRHLLSALDEFRSIRVQFVSLTEAIDTSTALGQALFTIIAVIGELERSLIRERVLAGVARARRRLATWGRPRRWTLEQVKRARRLRAEGRSWREIAMALGLKVRTIRRAVAETPSPETPSP